MTTTAVLCTEPLDARTTQISATARPWRARDDIDHAVAEERARTVEAIAGYRPLDVTLEHHGDTVTMCGAGWTRVIRPGAGAPNGAPIVGALRAAKNRLRPAAGFCVTTTDNVADVLEYATQLRDTIAQGGLDTEELRAQHCISGLWVTGAHLVALSELDTCVHRVERIATSRVPARTRLRFGAAAEAGYHGFCQRHGHDLVSTDGSAISGTNTYGWSWFAHEHHWAAGAGYCAGDLTHGAAAAIGEYTAVLEALDAHRGRHVALTYDSNTLERVGTGTQAPTCELGAALYEACEQRTRDGYETLWFPLSAKSTSQRHAIVDSRSSDAEHALLAGDNQVWGPDTGPPPWGPRRRCAAQLP